VDVCLRLRLLNVAYYKIGVIIAFRSNRRDISSYLDVVKDLLPPVALPLLSPNS